MVVLVTGANGQLGQSIHYLSKNHPEIDFVFCNSQELDITNKRSVDAIFEKIKPAFCINTAAYTAVDKAESDQEMAQLINVTGPENLALACKNYDAILLHVSTDFVFDGLKNAPYQETDVTNPQSIYGQTKLDGEIAIQTIFKNHFIIRTSWVYSQFGNNFMKTMLRLGAERDSLSIVNDQIGTPTNAVDLSEVLIKIIIYYQKSSEESLFGIYHFSNEGECSWFDFANKIFEFNDIKIDLQPIPTSAYPTPAKRPAYSVLDKSNIKSAFSITIKSWEESLKEMSLNF